MSLTRKQFLHSLAGVVGLGALGATALAGCGGDDDPATPDAAVQPDAATGANCATNGTTAVIGTNHGHALTVSAADVTAGVEKTYDIRGTSAHPHSVTITAALFTMLQANTMITVTSSTDGGHAHTVTVRCA